MSEAISVNFGKPMPVFPLPETVLLPHALQPMQIFETSHRTMINHCLDGNGQFALATFEGTFEPNTIVHETPSLRSAVCVCQILQHETMEDGMINILLHGVCRAHIEQLFKPDDEQCFFRAHLTPLETGEQDLPNMEGVRRKLYDLLSGPRLKRMRRVETVIEWFDKEEVTTHALLELIGFALVRDNELKYQLLAEADPQIRASLILEDLNSLDHIISRADRQNFRSWPKGMSWN